MKRPDTWMPLYVGDYLRDTGDLTTIEHGAYLLLIMQAWTRGGALPIDMERLRALTRMNEADWHRSSGIIMALFYQDGDVYRHKRIDKELMNATAFIEQRRNAGKASANRRKSNENSTTVEVPLQREVNETSTTVERPLLSRCLPVEVSLATGGQRDAIPSPSPSPKKEEKETSLRDAKKPDARKTQVPPDWTPDAEGVAYAKERGLTPSDLEAFRDHYRAQGKPMMDWSLVWKNWCRNARKYGTVAPSLPGLNTSGVSV